MKSHKFILQNIKIEENEKYGLVMKVKFYSEVNDILLDNFLKILETHNENREITLPFKSLGMTVDISAPKSIDVIDPDLTFQDFDYKNYERIIIYNNINFADQGVGKMLYGLQQNFNVFLTILPKSNNKKVTYERATYEIAPSLCFNIGEEGVGSLIIDH